MLTVCLILISIAIGTVLTVVGIYFVAFRGLAANEQIRIERKQQSGK